MSIHTHDILARLNGYWDYVARRPVTPTTLARLEAALGLPLPPCLRAYLETVGLFQDLTQTTTNPILLFETISEYESARRDLLDGLYGETNMKLVPFGHDGTGDGYALLTRPDGDADVFFMIQDTASGEATGFTFNQWLAGIVEDVRRNIYQRAPNHDKSWNVQFTFRGADFDTILRTMQRAGHVGLPQDWEQVETTASGVRKSTAHITLNDRPLVVRRLEYPHWVTPWYFIDMAEPLEIAGQPSAIQELDDLFHERLPGYGFINFGALLPGERDSLPR